MINKNIFCTICSKNYLPYAFSLYDSYRERGGSDAFVLLLVDKKEGDTSFFPEGLNYVHAEDLEIPRFNDLAFVYDITEFNTALKPTFLKYLLKAYHADTVTYLDPDTYLFARPTEITRFHDEHSIVFSPHILTPHGVDDVPGERMYLKIGNFNLGFASVRNDENTAQFLDWWEERCLNLCFNEPYTGLFVDQKWCNLAPMLFEGTHAARHFGINMGNWNLHERRLAIDSNGWQVNGDQPLVFFHFSGFVYEDDSLISRHTDKLSFADRPDLKGIFDIYRRNVEGWKKKIPEIKYTFGTFNNNRSIPNLARKLFLASPHLGNGLDPFSHETEFYRFLNKRRLLETNGGPGSVTSQSIDRNDKRLRIFNLFSRMAATILGGHRYEQMTKYLAYISMPRNQGYIFFEKGNQHRQSIDF